MLIAVKTRLLLNLTSAFLAELLPAESVALYYCAINGANGLREEGE